MTWLGKILTIVVFLGVVVWAYFTVQAFALRTNWKKMAEDYKAAYANAVAARESEYNRYRASEDGKDRLLAIEKSRSDSLARTVAELQGEVKKANLAVADIQNTLAQADVKAIKLEANVQAMTAEVAGVRKRNVELENSALRLVTDKEDALREMVRARNSERLALAIADDNAKKVEDLLTRISDLKTGGGTGQGAVLRAINKPPPPVPAQLRGTVTDTAGDLLVISVGIDSGMAVGTVLDVYRAENGSGRYLGKVKVTSANNLFPKEAIVSFTPARDVPFGRLTPDELPKKGDKVRPPEALGN